MILSDEEVKLVHSTESFSDGSYSGDSYNAYGESVVTVYGGERKRSMSCSYQRSDVAFICAALLCFSGVFTVAGIFHIDNDQPELKTAAVFLDVAIFLCMFACIANGVGWIKSRDDEADCRRFACC